MYAKAFTIIFDHTFYIIMQTKLQNKKQILNYIIFLNMKIESYSFNLETLVKKT